MPGDGGGFGLRPSLGGWSNNGRPTVLALRAGHDHGVTRLNGLRIRHSFDGIQLQQLGGTLLLSEPRCWRQQPGGDRQSGAAAAQGLGGDKCDGFHNDLSLDVWFTLRPLP